MLPRHSRARNSKLSRLKVRVTDPPKPRPRLNEAKTQQLAALMRERFGFEPKDFQIAAVKAQIEGVDMIVQASTGAGKTAIAAGPHLWPGNEKKFTIMTCPLLSLEEEMVQTFENEYGLKAIALNSKNGACEPEKINDILALKYQIILISPEMLQSRTFHNRVISNSAFMRNMISMFIDEAHCVVHWGAEFRKKYGTLGKLRAFFPHGTPVIAVSATLTPRVVRAIHRSLYFTQSEAQWRFINKGNDRSNVSLVVRACEHTLNSYADLDFLIPSDLRDPLDIPKTYLYVDNITIGSEIIDYLNARILSRLAALEDSRLSRKARKRLRGIVRPFNATLSSHYRTRAMARFRSGQVRILVCTDAAGMRAGRAARGPGRTGIAILLVERSVYNVDLMKASQPSAPKPSKTKKTQSKDTTQSAPKRDPKQVREYAIAHGLARGASTKLDDSPTGEQPPVHEDDADEGLHAFVQSTLCRRKAWAAAFESGIAAPTVPCCDICDPTLLDQVRPPPATTDKRAKTLKRGEPDLAAREKLYMWRETVYTRDHQAAQYDDTGVIPDDFLDLLVSHGALSLAQVGGLLQDKWVFWCHHGPELSALVASLDITFQALPPKSRRSAKKPLAAPIPMQLDNDPGHLADDVQPIPSASIPNDVTFPHREARPHRDVYQTHSIAPPPTPHASVYPPSYPPPPAHHTHAFQLPASSHRPATPSPRYEPSQPPARYYTQYPPSSSASASHSHQEYPVPEDLPFAEQPAHHMHSYWTSAHAAATPPMQPPLQRTVAGMTPSTDIPQYYEHAYSPAYHFYETQSQHCPQTQVDPSMMPPLPPHLAEAPSLLFVNSHSEHHHSPSPAQYPAQALYHTAHHADYLPSQTWATSSASEHGAPQSESEMGSFSLPYDTYYSDSMPEQHESMHF